MPSSPRFAMSCARSVSRSSAATPAARRSTPRAGCWRRCGAEKLFTRSRGDAEESEREPLLPSITQCASTMKRGRSSVRSAISFTNRRTGASGSSAATGFGGCGSGRTSTPSAPSSGRGRMRITAPRCMWCIGRTAGAWTVTITGRIDGLSVDKAAKTRHDRGSEVDPLRSGARSALPIGQTAAASAATAAVFVLFVEPAGL